MNILIIFNLKQKVRCAHDEAAGSLQVVYRTSSTHLSLISAKENNCVRHCQMHGKHKECLSMCVKMSVCGKIRKYVFVSKNRQCVYH